MTVAELAERLAKARKRGRSWTACCPAHEDHTPSLSITEQGGKILLKCHAGCSATAIVAALGLTMRDLMDTTASSSTPVTMGRLEIGRYVYHDADGRPVYQIRGERTSPTEKTFKVWHPDPTAPDGWAPGINGAPRVLYRLPELLDRPEGAAVFVVEGEKHADRLASLGLTATTSPFGAGKWHTRYNTALRGADVIVLPDNDAPGEAHGRAVADTLTGVAASVRVIQLPGLPPKGDIIDWLDAGHTAEELVALGDQTPEWDPRGPGAAATAPPEDERLPAKRALTSEPVRERRLVTVEAVNIKPKPIGWEWYRRILGSGLSVLEGDPDMGKTATILDFLARKSAGLTLGDGEPTLARKILVVGAEDALENVVIPRFLAAGGDLTRLRVVKGVLNDGRHGHLRLPSDIDLLALEMGDRDIVYFDGSINDYAERGVRPGDDIAMRDLLGSVADLAKDAAKTAIVSRHLRKGGAPSAIEAGSGTMGVAAKARSILALYYDPKDPDTKLLAHVKCNLAPKAPTLRLRLYSDEPDSPVRVKWLGEDPRTANEIREQIHRAERGSEKDKSKASKMLVEWLRDGRLKTVAMLKELAATSGITWNGFEYAAEQLGVEKERIPGGGWAWKDPYFEVRKRGGE